MLLIILRECIGILSVSAYRAIVYIKNVLLRGLSSWDIPFVFQRVSGNNGHTASLLSSGYALVRPILLSTTEAHFNAVD